MRSAPEPLRVGVVGGGDTDCTDGKMLQVSGKVEKVDTEFFDEDEYVVRVSDGSQFAILTVNCHDLSSDEVSSLKRGDDITVVGEFDDGGDLGVEIKDCKIV